MANIGHNQQPFVSLNSLNESQKTELKNAIRELNDSMTRVAAERDFQKDSINAVSDKTGVNKKIIRRMAKVYHRQNFTQEREEHEEFETLYETITNTTTMKEQTA